MAITYVRKVRAAELKTVVRIINEAKQVLQSRNVDLWQKGYPDQTVLKDDIARQIAYFLICDEQIVGVAALEDQGEAHYEQLIEGSWSKDSKEQYAVIHRVAICQGHQGEGLASTFIQHLLSVAAVADFKDIRIDTHVDNVPMQHVILKNGFQQCGRLEDSLHTPCFAYQKFI
ncbi:GNAT family N-acetyltransferase [Lactobacillus sp. DCY120]|uniref:GNAT family N-acetyltransferase n=1 Tax=Bombilactobacillus apium TaxID=2675299 RepID=A0A850R0F9_9LACO|nr:GNAT family N-acetyltransferase [Bombilactobacillus apium]NVY96413.1 GNAT family N-acetyltransferase [Bombilactobacillus apium]